MEKRILEYREIGTEKWYRSLARQVREWNRPVPEVEVTAPPDPGALDGLIDFRFPWQSIALHVRAAMAEPVKPFATTARPIAPPTKWKNQKQGLPHLMGAVLHVAVVFLVLVGFPSRMPDETVVQETFVPLYLPPDLLVLREDDTVSGGGGGGGNEALTVPSLCEAPRAAEEQLVPPSAEDPVNPDPLLVMEPTIVAPQLASLLPVLPPELGDPYDGIPAPPSSGPGQGGGIGTGVGTGVGPGEGAGLGPGEGAGFGGGVFQVGVGITNPVILSSRDPVYSEEARKARYEGTVILEAIVRADGTVDILRVVRSPGLGLDQQAIDAVKEWRFRPAMRAGVPVDVAMSIRINFNLH